MILLISVLQWDVNIDESIETGTETVRLRKRDEESLCQRIEYSL
ncbi:hypothetical protein [Elizabethkingia anophelis]